ncbi:MAG: glycine betaine ABC transporter substrate-binding protein [Gammaproteobacteria bacterium]
MLLSLTASIWTIPSLAILANLIPRFGIGTKPALITLSIYAILPIIKNTVLGMETIPTEIHEASISLGFTPKQKLLMIDLPLALPILITGLRISVSITIGVATLAAFVGAGGLGDFINQGLALNNNALILLGAIPAAIMALLLDQLIVIFWKYFSKGKKLIFTFVILLFPTILYFSNRHINTNNAVTIASKNFTESMILAELAAQVIERKTHIPVIRKFNLGTTPICQTAILNHQIDLYPEYTGTAYMTVMKKKYIANSDIFNTVKNYYQNQFALTWLAPFGFKNKQVIAVNENLAKRFHLNKISDLYIINNHLIIGVPAEFLKRPDGFITLNKQYALEFIAVKQMDPGLLYDALKNNKVDVINAFSTDGRIPEYHLVTLSDDKQVYPPYEAALIVRSDTLKKYPKLYAALKPLFGKIDDKTMEQLNYQVDVLKKSPSEVAKSFLRNI